eukprot:gene5214-10434_t
MVKWLLQAVEVENFKSIERIKITFDEGFSVITGPNGSGKSNILEAISFGLGCGSTELRSKTLKDLSRDNSDDARIMVKLTFKQDHRRDISYVLGSSVINGTRAYFIDNDSKVTKTKFLHFIHKTLGFATETVCWNISQKAVQNIVASNPTTLYNSICDVAGTQYLLQMKNLVEENLKQSESQLYAVTKTIKILEDEISRNNISIDLFNKLDTIRSSISINEKALEHTNIMYAQIQKYELFTNISNIRKEIFIMKKVILNKAIHMNTNGNDNDNEYSKDISKLKLQLHTLNKTLSEHESNVSELSQQLCDVQTEYDERLTAINNAQSQLPLLQQSMQSLRYELHSILYTEIPVVCDRITALEESLEGGEKHSAIGTASGRRGSSSSNDDVDVVVAMNVQSQRIALLEEVSELCSHSESLLMALTASAAQSSLQLTSTKDKLRLLKQKQSQLTAEMNRIDNKLKESDDITAAAAVAPATTKVTTGNNVEEQWTADDLMNIQNKLKCLQQRREGLAASLRLASIPARRRRTVQGNPMTIPTTTTTVSSVSATTTSSSAVSGCYNSGGIWRVCEGDLGYLADLIRPVHDDFGEFTLAMNTILMSTLSVRICRDSDAVRYLLEYCEEEGGGGVVIVDPLSLITWDDKGDNEDKGGGGGGGGDNRVGSITITKAVMKAMGSWIIVRNESQISSLLREPGVRGCVTLDGNRHTLGSLSVGSRAVNKPAISFLGEYATTRNELLEVEEIQKKISSYLEHQSIIQKQKYEKEKIISLLHGISQDIVSVQLELQQYQNTHKMKQNELEEARKRLDIAEARRLQLEVEVEALKKTPPKDVIALSIEQDRQWLSEQIAYRMGLEERITEINYELQHIERKEQQYLILLNKDSLEKLNSLQILLKSLKDKESTLLFHCKSIETQSSNLLEEIEVLKIKEQSSVVLRNEAVEESLHIENQIRNKTAQLSELLVSAGLSRERVEQDRQKDIEEKECCGSEGGTGVAEEGTRGSTGNEEFKRDIAHKTAQLSQLQEKYNQIRHSLVVLQEGVTKANALIKDLHNKTYDQLRERCSRYFSDLVPGRRADLVKVNEDRLEDGLQFVLGEEGGGGGRGGGGVKEQSCVERDGVEEGDEDEDEDNTDTEKERGTGSGTGSWRGGGGGGGSGKLTTITHRGVQGLSGGQKALLGLAFVFASALLKRSPLYLLDEVDAALDETNQQAVGKVIASIFDTCQVICVSHHTGFQRQAQHSVPIIMRNGHTELDL